MRFLRLFKVTPFANVLQLQFDSSVTSSTTSRMSFTLSSLQRSRFFGPILDVLLLTLPRDNLLSSACLDTFEYIRKENIKDLIKHVVESYREKVNALSYIEVFKELVKSYDNNRFPLENLFRESSDDEMGRRPTYIHGRMVEHMGMDREEEEYWDGPDNEDEGQNLAARNPLAHGSGALSALVDYHSDEESDENGDVVMKSAKAEEAKGGQDALTKVEEPSETSKPADTTPETTPPPPALTPPERLSEKRRREEEDDDEMGKMMQHKRRNCQSSISNAAGAAAMLRKKQPFNLAPKSAGAGPKKIDIRTTPSSSAERRRTR